ncbi:MAG: pilus assembly protein TadG-related protein [Jatrophihabitans sp.]
MRRLPDSGSTIPLLLGFALIAFYVVAGAIAAGDAYTDQLGVQRLCDGAALAAANAVDASAVRTGGATPELPLRAVNAAVIEYVGRDAGRQTLRARADLDPTNATVTVACDQPKSLAFGAMFLRRTVTHHATASAQAPYRDPDR